MRILTILFFILSIASCRSYDYAALNQFQTVVLFQIQPVRSGLRSMNFIVSPDGKTCLQIKGPQNITEKCKKLNTPEMRNLWACIDSTDFTAVRKTYQTGEDSDRKRIMIRKNGKEILATEFSTGEPKVIRELEKQLMNILTEYE